MDDHPQTFQGAVCPEMGLRPIAGDLQLPALTVDGRAFSNNRDLFHRYARTVGVKLAPHAKTPMSAEIAVDLVRAGSWGATVANLQQAEAMLSRGIPRLLLANGLGGKQNSGRLASLRQTYRNAEVICTADSLDAVGILAQSADLAGQLLAVLVEVGTGRTGARSVQTAEAIAQAIAAHPLLVLTGVTTYEGSVEGPTEEARLNSMNSLFVKVQETFRIVRRLNPGGALILSAGGSLFFDRAVAALSPAVDQDGNAFLLLRSGAIFFSDHGIYKKGLAAMDQRGGFVVDDEALSAEKSFVPAIKLWAEVLSLPEPGLAICGFGMRDASYDQGLPVPLKVFREGQELQDQAASALEVFRLNDQHAYLRNPASIPLRVGDVISFGISHPCTCFDRWRRFFVLSEDGKISGACSTLFS